MYFHVPQNADLFWVKFRADPTPTYDPQTVLNLGPEISGVSETIVYEKASSASDPVLKPAGYVSGIKGEVSAVFRTDCEKTVYLRAVGPDGYELPWKQAQVLQDGKIAYPRTKLSKTFPGEVVQYYYRFKLDWYASTSPNPGVGEARLIDFSFNPLYVLHDVPRDGHELFYEHSLVDLACRNAAGADDEPEIIEAIYEQFESRQVKRYESNLAMKYWGGGTPPQSGAPASALCFTYQGLFAYDDATCGAWADLFYNLLKVQGLKEGSATQGNLSELPRPSLVLPNYPLSVGASG